MKKILDSKFLFIVALSLIVLIILGVGAFYLFDDSDATFVKDGYVLNPLSAKSEKYFFDEATNYKENLSAMIEFKDTDNVDVTILKDSFLHYLDGSLSFLKNGAILDLDSIEGTKAVDFYNITNKSIIERKSNGYVINAKNGDINLKNFVGRISDNKYIVVGSLEAKIPGNNTNIKGDYFEIVYTEEGVINIENKDNKFQVTAEGTLIYAGDATIDLGNKKITKNGEDVMSITAITIDGNENIEIIPKTPEAPSTPSNNDGNGGAGNGNDTDNQQGDTNQGGENGDSQDANNEKEGVFAELKDATVGSTYANLIFNIDNQTAEDVFNLKITNLDTGRTEDVKANVNPGEGIPVDNLTPGTKYLFTLENKKDNGKYVQKVLQTKGFGISFEKKYATDSSLAYTVSVSEDSDVLEATLSIMKYDEDKKTYVPVVVTNKDSEGNEISKELSYQINVGDSTKREFEREFSGLDSNTIYTAVLNKITVGGGNNGKAYEMSQTDLTLKKAPDYSKLNPVPGLDKKSFKLAIDGIDDPDNAIVSYTYYIYEYGHLDEPAIEPIVRNDASPIEVFFGNGENQLKNDSDNQNHKYFYRAVIRHYDNEKYVERVTEDSIGFSIGTEPYITVVPEPEDISYNSIGAKVYILDNSCTIPMPNRECAGENTARVKIGYDTGAGRTYVTLSEEQCGFTATDNEIMCHFTMTGLNQGTSYYIDVEAVRHDYNSSGVPENIQHTSDSVKYIDTKSLSEFTVDWNLESSQAKSNKENVIYIDPKLLPGTNVGTFSPADTIEKAVKKIRVQLFEDDKVIAVQTGAVDPIASFTISDVNFKEAIYDKRYPITLDQFGLIYDETEGNLVSTKGEKFKLKENYTLSISAFYDNDRPVEIKNNVTSYKVSPLLFIDDLDESKIHAVPIKKVDSKLIDNKITGYLNNDGTIVGYHIYPEYDLPGLNSHNFVVKKIHVFVNDEDGNEIRFYDKNGNLVSEISDENVLSNEDGYYIYMTYGEDYGKNDKIMRRGKKYNISFSLEVDTGKTVVTDGIGAKTESPLIASKEVPNIITYTSTSNENSISFVYDIKDPDKAIYKPLDNKDYSFYYTINDGEEKSIDITNKNDNYNAFGGHNMTLTGLSNGDSYKLYYKRNPKDTGDFENDVQPEYVAETKDGRLFDGFYDAKDYNLDFEVINNPETNNKVIIKILSDEAFLDRFVGFKVKLTSPAGNYTTNDLTLQKCDDDTIRCLSIDYILFKNLKSSSGHENLITVSINALYDTGIIGFDYELGSNEYMIFQNNNANNEYGRYASYSSKGQITNWVDDINVPKGFYTYSFVEKNGESYIRYKSNKYEVDFGYVINENGYVARGVSIGTNTLNPKIVREYNIIPTKQNTFSFYSITPMIKVNRTTYVINGASVNMNLTGVDQEGLKDFCDNTDGNTCINDINATKYLYIETWASEEDANSDTDFSKTVRDRLRVKLESNPMEPVTANIYKLNSDSRYYFRVYTYLNKNNKSVYTRLFNDNKSGKAELVNYPFKSLSSSELFGQLKDGIPAIDFVVSDDEGSLYNDKKLKTNIALNKYNNGVSFNFDIGYAFCKNDDATCGLKINEYDSNYPDNITNIFEKVIPNDVVKNSFANSDMMEDYVDISDKNIEFGTNYRVYIYAIYDYYDKENNNPNAKRYLLLNRRNYSYPLRELAKPYFESTRHAGYDNVNNKYYIDLGVTLHDSDNVLTNGEFSIQLLENALSDNPTIVGDLQIKEDGNWKTIDWNSKISIVDKFVEVRISGLPTANTPYTVVLDGLANLNNYSEDIAIEDRVVKIEKRYDVYTSDKYGVAFGSVSTATTANSLELRFIGGSNLVERVCNIDATIIRYQGSVAINTFNPKFHVPEDRTFTEDAETGNWRFIIDGDNLSFDTISTYSAKILIDICNRQTGDIEKEYTIERSDLTHAESN